MVIIMNNQEVLDNIGKRVVLDPSTKPYRAVDTNSSYESAEGKKWYSDQLENAKHLTLTDVSFISNVTDDVENAILQINKGSVRVLINPKHLKLAEKQEPQEVKNDSNKFKSYKIFTKSEKENDFVQSLLKDLGYGDDKSFGVFSEQCPFVYTHSDGCVTTGNDVNDFCNSPKHYVGIDELRMIGKLNRNDIKHASHEDANGRMFCFDDRNNSYIFENSAWKLMSLEEVVSKKYFTRQHINVASPQNAVSLLLKNNAVEFFNTVNERWETCENLTVKQVLELENAYFRIQPSYRKSKNK